MACDDNYLYPWAVAFTSAVRHSRVPLDVWFGLASDWGTRMPGASLERLLALIESTGSNARAVEVQVETRGLPASSYISPTAFVKLGLFDLCPSEATMVWLDADLVARSPWTDVLSASEGFTVSGSHEFNPSFESRWPAATANWYVNTGVVVVHGNAWQRNFAGNWQPYLDNYEANGFRYMDQDVLNALIRDQWNHIDSTYNFRPIHEKVWTDPAIVHYSGRYKPWLSTAVQERLLKGVWRPSFDAFFDAETQFIAMLEGGMPDVDRRFWMGERKRLRGVLGHRAWRYYAGVLAQGAFKLN